MPLHRSPDLAPDSWSSLISESPVAVLYKHSPTCGLSDIAMDEVTAFLQAHPDVPVHLVDVLSQRAVSNAVESALGIRHESPQAFVFREGVVRWHGSHRRVTRAALAEAVAAAGEGAGAPRP
jgi:bacillithiol system protein YtxJ